jgi:hypothetical protein
MHVLLLEPLDLQEKVEAFEAPIALLLAPRQCLLHLLPSLF